jgi:outer membrane protein assembly factor BamD
MMTRFSILALVLIPFSVSLFGCAGKVVDEKDPASMMADAEDEIKNDHFLVALDKLRIIKNKFPYSNYSLEAHLRIGDVYFLQESYPEAAATYESFKDLHPKHTKVAYAMFRLAKSYFNDAPDVVARDQTVAKKALESYNDFLKRFPSASETEEARKDVAQIRKNLAEKELYIGDFYNKREHPDAAAKRYDNVLRTYPETDAAKEAQAKREKLGNAQPQSQQ